MSLSLDRHGRGRGRTCAMHAIRRFAAAQADLVPFLVAVAWSVCLVPWYPLESAVLPERHAVKILAVYSRLQLYWGLSWARLLFLTSRPSGVYL